VLDGQNCNCATGYSLVIGIGCLPNCGIEGCSVCSNGVCQQCMSTYQLNGHNC